MSTLDDVKAELLAAETARPRARQVESGASQVFGCRAESLFRLTGQPQTDPHLSWEAEVGSAIHALLESTAAEGIITECRVRYRGIPATIDRYSPFTFALTDYKSKNTSADIAKVQKYGPTQAQRAQVHLGAAGLMETHDGLVVERVELLYVPRAGNLDSAYLWGEPFDQKLADEAADWLIHEMIRGEAISVELASGLTQSDAVLNEIDYANLRDEDPLFCYTYCPFVTACRGEREPQVTDLDDITDAAAAKHMEGKSLVEQGESQMAEVRHYLEGLRGNSNHYRVMTSGGGQKTVQKEDLEELRKTYKYVYGDDAELPVVEESYTTPVRLTVKPRKDNQ